MQSETMIPDRELTRALQVFSFNGLCLTLPMCQFIEFNMPLLQPLSVGKSSQRILVKSPKSKEIEPSHTFSINEVGNTYYCFVTLGYRCICLIFSLSNRIFLGSFLIQIVCRLSPPSSIGWRSSKQAQELGRRSLRGMRRERRSDYYLVPIMWGKRFMVAILNHT